MFFLLQFRFARERPIYQVNMQRREKNTFSCLPLTPTDRQESSKFDLNSLNENAPEAAQQRWCAALDHNVY